VPNLSSLAQQKYDLVLGVGFLMADAMDTVAKRFPDTNFAIVDFSAPGLKSKPKNVRGLLFKEAEAGYLAGLPGRQGRREGGLRHRLLRRRPEDPAGGRLHRGLPGRRRGGEPGHQDPQRLLAGLRRPGQVQGARALADPARLGRRLPGGGQCGLGALDAAKEQDKLGIGVDADQSFLGEHILTSAQKKVDVSVFETIKSVQDGAFRAARTRSSTSSRRAWPWAR
jgi:basic membrane protein A